jgi:hypothetical protein
MSAKALRAADGTVFGPFSAVISSADHFDCDGVIYPRAVVGNATIKDWIAKPPLPPPPPAQIKRVQLILGLVNAGLITPEEGPPASSGMVIPAAIEGVFSTLPEAEAVEARIRFNGAADFDRANPLINAVGWIAASKTPAEMDDYWREWSAL